jgi:O-antigen/teichoic acid export membrane protein
MRPLDRLVRRIGRHGSVYLTASVVVGLAGVAQVAVLTRLLTPTQFGQLAILTVFSASMTLLLNLGSLQGSFRAVFGTAGEDAVDGEDEPQHLGDPRRALGNALALTTALAFVGAVAVAAFSRSLADLLLGDPGMATSVAIAGLAGGLGAVWRLAVNVPRLERRASVYALETAGRALLVLTGATLGVAVGGGVEGAIAGIASGTGVGLTLALAGIRNSVAPSFAPRQWREIFVLGAGLVPVVLASWAMQNGDVLILSAYAPESDVGIYRAGSRIAAIVAYATSALLMAWGPLMREPLYAAVDARHGRLDAGVQLATGFLACCLTLLLAVTLFARDVVQVAGDSFEAAATVIPLVAAGLVVQAQFVVVYRIAQLPAKRRVFVVLSVAGALVFVVAALLLVPPFEGVGAALALLIGYAISLIGMLVVSQRGDQPLPIDDRRLLSVCGLFAATLAAGLAGRTLADPAGVVAALLALAAYPVALVATGVVPRSALAALRARGPRHDHAAALRALPASDLAVVRAAALGTSAPERIARLEGDDEAALRWIVAALRKIAAVSPSHPADVAVARYLFDPAAPAERDRTARGLWSTAGVDPLELEALTVCLAGLRRLSPEEWDAALEARWREPDEL